MPLPLPIGLRCFGWNDLGVYMEGSAMSLGTSCATLQDGVLFMDGAAEEQALLRELQDWFRSSQSPGCSKILPFNCFCSRVPAGFQTSVLTRCQLQNYPFLRQEIDDQMEALELQTSMTEKTTPVTISGATWHPL